jgi:glycosyltransferase involved in cell wall biosynthesis
MDKLKILFISHTFPPIVGGVETHNFELSTWLRKQAEIKLIINRKRWLIPFFLVYSAFKAVLMASKYDAVVLGSCLLSNVGWLVKIFSKKPVVTVAHGLDLTWNNFIYQKLWVGIFIKKIDKFIAVGNETMKIASEKNIPAKKIVFIPNGVDTEIKGFVNALYRYSDVVNNCRFHFAYASFALFSATAFSSHSIVSVVGVPGPKIAPAPKPRSVG